MNDSTCTPTPRQQVSLSFAYLAYSGLLLPGDPRITAPKILKLMNKWMRQISPLLTDGEPDWKIVWGPVVYYHKRSHFIQDNLMFVAQQISQPANYVIAVRGTNPFSIWSWMTEDFAVFKQTPWEPGGPGSPKISQATQNGMDVLLHKMLPVKKVPGAGLGIEKFLGGLAASGKVNLLFTGHSLGGTLSPTLALWFKQSQNQADDWDPQGNADISTVPFAGLTAGDRDFVTLFNHELGAACDRIHNTLDIAPHAWEMALLEQLPDLYLPDIHMTRFERELLDCIEENVPVYIQPATGDAITWTIQPEWKSYLVQAAFQHVSSYPNLLYVPELLEITDYLKNGLPAVVGATMHPRVQTLIDSLQLLPHPEGGYYREIFRSERMVNADEDRAGRKALTVIYFLLEAGQCSRWHRVLSDEVWSHLEGDVLELCCFDAASAQLTVSRLGPYAPETEPTRVVPAGTWQAAQPLGAFTLAGCIVGPGFEFSDFSMAAGHPDVADAIRAQGERFGKLI